MSEQRIEKTPEGVRVFDGDDQGLAVFRYPLSTEMWGVRFLADDGLQVSETYFADREQREAIVAVLDPEAAKAKKMIAELKQRLREADPTDVDGADVEDWLQEWEKML